MSSSLDSRSIWRRMTMSAGPTTTGAHSTYVLDSNQLSSLLLNGFVYGPEASTCLQLPLLAQEADNKTQCYELSISLPNSSIIWYRLAMSSILPYRRLAQEQEKSTSKHGNQQINSTSPLCSSNLGSRLNRKQPRDNNSKRAAELEA